MTAFVYLVCLLHKPSAADVMVWIQAPSAKAARRKAMQMVAKPSDWHIFSANKRTTSPRREK